MCFQKLFIFLVLIFYIPIFSQNLITYSKIDPILHSTWEKSYPVMYSKILKKDLIGKGIIVIQEKKRLVYLYTFLIAFPKVVIQDEKLKVEQEDFKRLEVKLYYDPSKKEDPYWIDLGEVVEFYDKSKVVRYIK